MGTEQKVRKLRRRHRRVRKKVFGTPERPRLAVYRSSRHIYAQLIDDVSGHTVAAASSLKDADGEDPKARAKAVGVSLAQRAKKAGVSRVAFDRGGFKFHGRVAKVAEGAREGGLEF
ncbi:MAG: 50S ribosomal protein L18 [Actinomycetota bacterium]